MSIEDYMQNEETPKTPEIKKLYEEWRRLKDQDETKGRNDPNAPPMPKEQMQITARLLKVGKQLKRAIGIV